MTYRLTTEFEIAKAAVSALEAHFVRLFFFHDGDSASRGKLNISRIIVSSQMDLTVLAIALLIISISMSSLNNFLLRGLAARSYLKVLLLALVDLARLRLVDGRI